MTRPDFSAQNGDITDPEERRQWFQGRAEEFRQKGATFLQCSIHPTIPNLALAEGWKERQNPTPPPHFHLTHKTPEGTP